jgi:hypothetical protein
MSKDRKTPPESPHPPTATPSADDAAAAPRPPRKGISRREFARRAAIVSAVASWAPVAAASSLPAATQAQQPPPPAPKLAPEGQAEVEARVQAILSQYGERFSDEQKTDIRRLCIAGQPPLDRLRAYALENGDGPALYLKPLVEREKKPPAPAKLASPTAASPAAKSPAAAKAPDAAKKP